MPPAGLRDRIRAEVEAAAGRRGLPLDGVVVDTLTDTAVGWIAAADRPLAGLPAVPVPVEMYDDVADGFVQLYVHGLAEPPATRAQHQAKVRLMVASTLEQLAGARPAAAIVEVLVTLAFGRWDENEPLFLLSNYAREMAARCHRGRS